MTPHRPTDREPAANLSFQSPVKRWSAALLALALRIRTGGVAAAIAAHTGYNLLIVANALFA